ncbi:Hypothetical protein RG1141_CH41750 [Neorhizobium galegae bv. officinalis bv. officinalis str. HAMBI 1141]|uniref:PF09351 domain protein n=1 Tax=Neorhizobium galegae bv. officinalis bv. officinalis str. HAMBI 1141 TaxID=1028801 RepID=A0A068TEE1_NEOGA|nr:DUF1993 domain-containing protein [Neorhizobium galegae]CDN56489.1 Hypothetical protein RG1141_CH41750 [Neorhizobium galegae bv. officinalis bv. officinalis str. HAMBI 1141]
MSLTLYDVTVPVFIRAFGNLTEILKKGEAFADEKGLAHKELLETRLVDDMYPLISQIQRASDTAKFVPVRVGQIENIPMADEEVTFADLHARIEKTVALLNSVDPATMANREDAEVIVKTRSGETKFTGKSYVLGFALPNFYFHVTTAYAILRHKGVPIGKMDYIGRSQ